MRICKWITAILLLTTLFGVFCQGQKTETKDGVDQATEPASNDSILIGGLGGMRVRLGMEKSVILDRLKDYYSAVPSENGDVLAIVEKGKPNSVALISLKDGRVT